MKLNLLRTKFFKTHTVGQLYVDGVLFCFVLEDVVREETGKKVEDWKVQDETAIPTGNYIVTLEQSKRFGPDTPTLNKVPGFDYIRIHSGNDANHTEGCLILGYKLTAHNIIAFGTTRPAVADLKKAIKAAIDKGEEVWITVSGIAKS
jgi:hypothetical protein